MGPELPDVTLTLYYKSPENISFEEEVMDLGDLYAIGLVYPFYEEDNLIKAQFVFKNDQDLMVFKKQAVEVAIKFKIYVNFTS